MKILFLGWDNETGIGKACKCLLDRLQHLHDITFISPQQEMLIPHLDIDVVELSHEPIDLDTLDQDKNWRTLSHLQIATPLLPYLSADEFTTQWKQESAHSHKETSQTLNQLSEHSLGIHAAVVKFSLQVYHYAQTHSFDCIYAHDWMTFKAALLVQSLQNIPFIAHFHSTVFDRTLSHTDHQVYETEKLAIKHAYHTVAVSHLIEQTLLTKYNIDKRKISVSYPICTNTVFQTPSVLSSQPLILFVGRLVASKRPDVFVDIARDVLNHIPDAQFLICGDGTLLPIIQEKIFRYNLSSKIKCLGHVPTVVLGSLFAKATLTVHPAIVEPFGLAIVESIVGGCPVITTGEVGAKEIIPSLITYAEWDTYGIAQGIIQLCNNHSKRNAVLAQNQQDMINYLQQHPLQDIDTLFDRLSKI